MTDEVNKQDAPDLLPPMPANPFVYVKIHVVCEATFQTFTLGEFREVRAGQVMVAYLDGQPQPCVGALPRHAAEIPESGTRRRTRRGKLGLTRKGAPQA
jgi:hypothetical protein